MRVVTWNAQHGRPNPDGTPDLGRAVAPLRALDADVWAVQELDRGRRRSGGLDQPSLLAAGLGGRLLWAPTLHRGGAYGITLVTPVVVRSSEVVRLPGRGEPRVLLVSSLEVAGQTWTVATTHLSTDEPVAVRQLVVVLDELARWPAPKVLLGDLNLEPAQVLPWASPEGWQLATGPPTHSTRAARPMRRIDHVLAQGARMTATAVHDLGMSDHLAVTADLHDR